MGDLADVVRFELSPEPWLGVFVPSLASVERFSALHAYAGLLSDHFQQVLAYGWHVQPAAVAARDHPFGPGAPLEHDLLGIIDRFWRSGELLDAEFPHGGHRLLHDGQNIDVDVLYVFKDSALARVSSAYLIDLCQLARLDGEWKIVNVLWELKEEEYRRLMVKK